MLFELFKRVTQTVAVQPAENSRPREQQKYTNGPTIPRDVEEMTVE